MPSLDNMGESEGSDDEPMVPTSEDSEEELTEPLVTAQPSQQLYGVSPFNLELFHETTPLSVCRRVLHMAGETDSVDANRWGGRKLTFICLKILMNHYD